MKVRTLWILSAVSLFGGCELAEIQSWGDVCPPADASNPDAILAYIGTPECNADNIEACNTSDMANKDISIYFKTKNCPPEYRNCVAKSKNGDYYCEKDEKTVIVTECAQGKPCKNAEGKTFCLDEANQETCGATDCNAEAPTYGGKNCKKLHATCENLEGRYVCVNQENGKLVCGDEEISPADLTTCGANDCDLENYGGKDCEAVYGEGSICSKSKETSFYQCVCRAPYVMCNNKCVYPSIDKDYCGAKGECNSDDSNSENYRGAVCSSDDQKGGCVNGRCSCFGNNVWCAIDGLNGNKPQCFSPDDNETCGAKLLDDGIHCEINPCLDNYRCKMESLDSYSCELINCDENQQLCSMNGDTKCYSRHDSHHCGGCSIDCDINNYLSVKPAECKDNEEGVPSCAYQCEDGLTNCGSEFLPQCFDLNTSAKHCGNCETVCPVNSYCENGSCKATDCSETQCTSLDDNGFTVCINLDENCGKDCENCKNRHDNAYCSNGVCLYKSCKTNEHPIFNTSNQIENCEVNSASKCASSTIKVGEPIKDCTRELTQNVKSAGCTTEGTCYVSECVDGYHLSSDKASCEKNTPDVCGKGSSTTTTNCTLTAHAKTTDCIGNGKCTIIECESGYHLDANKTACVENNASLCGTPSSNETVSCMSAGVKSATCSNGKCVVTECNSNSYHISADKTKCEANADNACGRANEQGKDCTKNPYERTCVKSEGVCACSGDGSLVLNNDKNACVDKVCKGIPGVLAGTNAGANYYNAAQPDYVCKPTACAQNYRLQTQGVGAICRQHKNFYDCSKYGYASTIANWDICSASSAASCASTHKFYIDGCLPLDSCCGIKTDRSNIMYFQCTNCAAQNMRCDVSSGTCVK